MSEYCGSIARTLSKLTGGLCSTRVGMGCRIDKVRSAVSWHHGMPIPWDLCK